MLHRLHITQPESPAGTVPEWVHLMPAGKFSAVDGRGPFTLIDAALVIARSMRAGRLPIDENHATDLAAPAGGSSPALGWIVGMELRADGIWGNVDWCERGRHLMGDRAYNGISPVFNADKKGVIFDIVRAAVTNTPALPDLRRLRMHEQFPGDTIVDLTALRTALGVPETADDAAILAAATSGRAALAASTAHSQQLTAIIAAAGAKATDAAGLVTELAARRQAETDVQLMAAKVVGLETELNTIKTVGAQQRAVAFVDAQIAAGKPVSATRDHYIGRHVKDAVSVELELNAMASVNAGGTKPHKMGEDDGGEGLSQEEMGVCKRMGQTPKAFAANKAKMAADAAKRGN